MTEDDVVNLIRYPHNSMTVEQCLQVIAFIRSQGRKLAEFQQWWEHLEHRPACDHNFTVVAHKQESICGQVFGSRVSVGICQKCGAQP